MCAVASAPGVSAAVASESGSLCRDDGAPGRGDRRRRALMLASLRTRKRPHVVRR